MRILCAAAAALGAAAGPALGAQLPLLAQMPKLPFDARTMAEDAAPLDLTATATPLQRELVELSSAVGKVEGHSTRLGACHSCAREAGTDGACSCHVGLCGSDAVAVGSSDQSKKNTRYCWQCSASSAFQTQCPGAAGDPTFLIQQAERQEEQAEEDAGFRPAGSYALASTEEREQLLSHERDVGGAMAELAQERHQLEAIEMGRDPESLDIEGLRTEARAQLAERKREADWLNRQHIEGDEENETMENGGVSLLQTGKQLRGSQLDPKR